MTAATPAEMLRLLAHEFERRGWDYDLSTGRSIVEQAVADGGVNGARLASAVSSEFLSRAGVSRSDVGEAIERAIGGKIPRAEERPTSIVINDHRYSVNQGAGAQISNSAVNLGGVQINVNKDGSKGDLLLALQAIIRAGVGGNWNDAAARDLAALFDARDDIDADDVRAATVEVLSVEKPKPERMKELLYTVAGSGIGGALSTGLTMGVTELLGRISGS